LAGIDFEMSGQTFVSMVGPSGCGKSTFLNIVSGIETPTSGSIEVTNDQGGPARLGYVFQDPRLLPWRTVLDNMLYVHDKRDGIREHVQKYLDLVGLSGFEHMYPAHLSGGMQQRVGIARAFSVEPDLLLMDEPYSHLDAITARALRTELQDIWQKTKKTVLFVTHDVVEAVQLGDRVIIIDFGGKNFADMKIGLPYPRLQTDKAVLETEGEILAIFEDMERRRREYDPRITAKSEAEQRRQAQQTGEGVGSAPPAR
jgi:NitT/TauT family transport system ATP-binding protein